MSQEHDLLHIESSSREQLVAFVNELIAHDFNRLVLLLYRLDISEKKLKQTLHHHRDSNAGELITQLILERQEEKKKSRAQFKQNSWDIPEDEKW